MAAGSTYTPLATTTLGSANSTITFSSISGSYTDIVVILNGYQTVDDNVTLTFNGDTGSNYSMTAMFGTGSSILNFRTSNASSIAMGALYTSDRGNAIYQIMNYSNSTTYKTVLNRTNAPASGVQTRVGLWRSTSAINSITLTASGGGQFVTGTQATLYGIQAA